MMMPAITLHQPYASLIAVGAKRFETRSFPPPRKHIGQRIAIHAAQRPIQLAWRDLGDKTKAAIVNAFQGTGVYGDLGKIPHGAVVCTAVVSGAYEYGEPSTAYGGKPCWTVRSVIAGSIAINSNIPLDRFGDYSPGRWAWLLEDVRVLPEPLPAKGRQGWWSVDLPGEVL